MGVALLTVSVIAGSVGGFYGLSRIFRGAGEPAPNTAAAPTNGAIALSLHSYPSTQRIALLDPTGTGLRFLTTGDHIAAAPAWSPDGARVVFWRVGEGSAGLWIMNADGSEARPLYETTSSIGAIEWSPDGSRIGFIDIVLPEGPATELDFSQELYIMDADGANATPLIADGQVTDFDWSPDGTRLVIERQFGIGDDRIGSDLAVVDADGSREMPITFDGFSRDPTWSPDGSSIVYVRSANGDVRDRDLFAVSPEGAGRVQLTDDGATEENPVFSPDGSLIAYTRFPHGDGSDCELVLMRPNGSKAQVIATKQTLGGCPVALAWQPISQGDEISPPPSSSPTPTESPTPEASEDIGLGFPVCNVSSVDGHFDTPDDEATALVATRAGDAGGCPEPRDAFNVVAVDADGDGLAETSYGPIGCVLECRTFSAPDVDGDGIDEVAVAVDSTGGSTLFELYAVGFGTDPRRLGFECSRCNDGLFAWGGAGGHIEGVYCTPDPAAGDFVIWTAERSDDSDRYAVVETFIDVKGTFLVEEDHRDSFVPFDLSALPPGGGDDFCGAPVARGAASP